MELKEFVEYYKHKGLTIEEISKLYYFEIYKFTIISQEIKDNINGFYFSNPEINNTDLVEVLLEDRTNQLVELKNVVEITGGKEFKKLVSKKNK